RWRHGPNSKGKSRKHERTKTRKRRDCSKESGSTRPVPAWKPAISGLSGVPSDSSPGPNLQRVEWSRISGISVKNQRSKPTFFATVSKRPIQSLFRVFVLSCFRDLPLLPAHALDGFA